MKITVNGLEIPPPVFERELARAKQSNPDADEKTLAEAVKDQLVRQALLRGAALKQGASPAPAEVEAAYRNLTASFGGEDGFLKAHGLDKTHIGMVQADIEANMCVERLVNELTRYVVLPSEAKLREYHRRDKSVSVAPAQVHCAHIIKRPAPGVYETLTAARRKAFDGADFAALANELSDAQEKDGDLGFIVRGRMPEAFEDVAFSMNENEVSPIFRSPYGYHIVKVYAIRPERALSYEESEEMVKSAVMNQMRTAVVNEWISKQLKTAQIQVSA